jgi:carboxylesterase
MPPRLPQYLPGAMPQFYRGNAVGCLLLHGFMAAPPEVAWLGQYLAEHHHYTVYVPRLTGHGIDPAMMARLRWQDWYAHALDGYHLLRQQCERVYVIGHSMGALLAILLASAEKPCGAVLAAVPITPPNTLMQYAHLLNLVLPYTQHPSEPELNAAIEAEQQQRGDAIVSRVHYPRWSSRAIYELYLLMHIARETLSTLSIPLMLLGAKQDQTVKHADHHLIWDMVQSQHIEEHWLAKGAHLIFQDVGRDEAFHIVASFIERLECRQEIVLSANGLSH